MNTLPRFSNAQRAELTRRAQYLRNHAPAGLLSHVADVALKRLAGIETKTPEQLAREMIESQDAAPVAAALAAVERANAAAGQIHDPHRSLACLATGSPGISSRLNAKNPL